eukprot:10191827-Prorocentrum_lima.AAC.1
MKEYYHHTLMKKVISWWHGACDIATSEEESDDEDEAEKEKKEKERIINIMANPNRGMNGIIRGSGRKRALQ